MLTFLLVSLFILLTLVCIALVRQSQADPAPTPMERLATRPRDPFAPILRAGAETDDITTIKMLSGAR